MQLLYLGLIEVAHPDEHKNVPLITSLVFLPGFSTTGRKGMDDHHTLLFALTTSNHEVKLVKAEVPAIMASHELRFCQQQFTATMLSSIDLKGHSAEAWCAATTVLATIPSTLGPIHKLAILSGGDDSCIYTTSTYINPLLPDLDANTSVPATTISEEEIARRLETLTLNSHSSKNTDDLSISPLDIPLPLDGTSPILMAPPKFIGIDKKTHKAGVTAILALTPQSIPVASHTNNPILTGSYDESIRLHLLNSATCTHDTVLERSLDGGVFDLRLMDERVEASIDRGEIYSALVLASCMHAGVRILRITHDSAAKHGDEEGSSGGAGGGRDATDETQGWKMDVVMNFTKGHESIVYASDFRKERDEDGRCTGEYTIVSTSMYDCQICVWTFVDERATLEVDV